MSCVFKLICKLKISPSFYSPYSPNYVLIFVSVVFTGVMAELASLESAELKEAFDAFDKVSETGPVMQLEMT